MNPISNIVDQNLCETKSDKEYIKNVESNETISESSQLSDLKKPPGRLSQDLLDKFSFKPEKQALPSKKLSLDSQHKFFNVIGKVEEEILKDEFFENIQNNFETNLQVKSVKKLNNTIEICLNFTINFDKKE
jgi:hypothetical protein